MYVSAAVGVPLNVNTGAVALSVVCAIIVDEPVPPTIMAQQTVVAVGSGLVRVSVIVGLAPVVASAVIVHWQVWPKPWTAVTVGLVPQPLLSANSPVVQAVP